MAMKTHKKQESHSNYGWKCQAKKQDKMMKSIVLSEGD